MTQTATKIKNMRKKIAGGNIKSTHQKIPDKRKENSLVKLGSSLQVYAYLQGATSYNCSRAGN
jgi:hypothetical protein